MRNGSGRIRIKIEESAAIAGRQRKDERGVVEGIASAVRRCGNGIDDVEVEQLDRYRPDELPNGIGGEGASWSPFTRKPTEWWRPRARWTSRTSVLSHVITVPPISAGKKRGQVRKGRWLIGGANA